MEGQAGQAQALIGALLPFAVLMVLFYFMLIRPQKKQQPAARCDDCRIAKGQQGNHHRRHIW